MASICQVEHLPRRNTRRPAGIPTLVQLCQAILRANIHVLTDVGDVPFELIGPVLVRCNAEQLQTLEPIRSQTQDLWEALVVKEYPRAATECRTFEKPPIWRKVYQCHKREEQAKIDRLRRRFEQREQDKRREAQARVRHQAHIPPIYSYGPTLPSRSEVNRMSVVQRLRVQSARTRNQQQTSHSSLPTHRDTHRNDRVGNTQQHTIHKTTSTNPPVNTPTNDTRRLSSNIPTSAILDNEQMDTSESAATTSMLRVRIEPTIPGRSAIRVRRPNSAIADKDQSNASYYNKAKTIVQSRKSPDKAAADFFAILGNAAAAASSSSSSSSSNRQGKQN